MTLKQAFFILRHGSAEGNHKYLEAVKVIEDEYNRQKETIELLQTALFKCGENSAEIENYKNIAEHQQSISMDRFFEIQRLKEEIERLQKECDEAWEQYSESLVQYDLLFDEATVLIENAKSEAVKEFAERLKTNVFEVDDINEDTFLAVEVSYIDYLVKEYPVKELTEG